MNCFCTWEESAIADAFSMQISIKRNEEEVMASVDSLIRFGKFSNKEREVLRRIREHVDARKSD